jgi:hypothetical protein
MSAEHPQSDYVTDGCGTAREGPVSFTARSARETRNLLTELLMSGLQRDANDDVSKINPCNNGRGSDRMGRSQTHFRVDRRSPGYCRVTWSTGPSKGSLTPGPTGRSSPDSASASSRRERMPSLV